MERRVGSQKGRRGLASGALCALMMLCGLLMYGCATPDASSAALQQSQHIYLVMQPAVPGGESVADYSKFLSAGDEVSGNANVSGEWEVPGDSCTPWTYQLWNPAGAMIDSETIRFIPFDAENPYYDFSFTAAASGKYTMRIIHYSLLVRYLNIVVNPPGWQPVVPGTSG